MLLPEIGSGTEPGIHVVERIIRHNGYILGIVSLYRNAYFKISVQRSVQDVRTPRIGSAPFRSIDGIGVMIVPFLSALPRVTESTHPETHLHTVVRQIEPAVSQIELELFRHVHEAVMIMIR